jgi:hypothetical protein
LLDTLKIVIVITAVVTVVVTGAVVGIVVAIELVEGIDVVDIVDDTVLDVDELMIDEVVEDLKLMKL